MVSQNKLFMTELSVEILSMLLLILGESPNRAKLLKITAPTSPITQLLEQMTELPVTNLDSIADFFW